MQIQQNEDGSADILFEDSEITILKQKKPLQDVCSGFFIDLKPYFLFTAFLLITCPLVKVILAI